MAGWKGRRVSKLPRLPASPDKPAAVFAANVRRLREAKGLTMEQAGWAAGIDPTAWGRIESGQRRPNFATILKLAAALEVPPADLFAGIG
jgi:transcriptional regulator with XRE-family HTH domain